MGTYRVYSVKSSGQFAGPPALVEADSDREALIVARRFGVSLTLEVWQLARLVATLPPGHKIAASSFPPDPVDSPPGPDDDDPGHCSRRE